MSGISHRFSSESIDRKLLPVIVVSKMSLTAEFCTTLAPQSKIFKKGGTVEDWTFDSGKKNVVLSKRSLKTNESWIEIDATG